MPRKLCRDETATVYSITHIPFGVGRQTPTGTPEEKAADNLQPEFGILVVPQCIRLRYGNCWLLSEQVGPFCGPEGRPKEYYPGECIGGMRLGDILGPVYPILL